MCRGLVYKAELQTISYVCCIGFCLRVLLSHKQETVDIGHVENNISIYLWKAIGFPRFRYSFQDHKPANARNPHVVN